MLEPLRLRRPPRENPTPSRLDLLRRRTAARMAQTAGSVHDYLTYVGVEHLPPRRNEPRWGHGRPLHPRLAEIIAAERATYDGIVADVVSVSEDLLAIPIYRDTVSFVEPCWVNSWLPGLDTAVLYGLLRTRHPARYLEVGSGFSTRVAARAKRDGDLSTTITSIDQAPRAVVETLCDTVIRSPLEDVPSSTWEQLRSGDMVFIDNSHRALMHSDVTVFFLEILPSLPEGVLVGVHDILLPADYFAAWGEFLFSEQYLLAAYLLAGSPWVKPLFASYWASELSDTTAPLAAMFDELGNTKIDRRGWSFWFTVGQGRDRAT